MIIGESIKKKLSETPEGVVLTISDFNIAPEYQAALVKALNRLVYQGSLNKISKGKYYKPRKSIFGSLKPSPEEITKDFLEKNGKLIGYITGNSAFASIGLTTQITSSIVIGTNDYRHPLMRGDYKVSFLLQRNPITTENIPLLRILDAIKLIKNIPASSPDTIISQLGKLIKSLSKKQQEELLVLAEGYTSYVRALLGAIMEHNKINTGKLKSNLNGTTIHKISISSESLPNKQNWNIV